MPHMIGYLGGDHDTMIARKAVREDLRIAVEFPDERNMLVICVMQTGQIMLAWTGTEENDTVREMAVVGQMVEHDDGTHELVVAKPTVIPVKDSPVHFTKLRSVPDP